MTLVVASERDGALELQEAELMAARNISGLLVVTSLADDNTELEGLQSTGLVIVALERPLGGLKTDAVLVENRKGACAAVEHLLGHGHKQIACVGYDTEVFTTRERLIGYEETMRKAKLPTRITTGLNTLESMREWLALAIKAKRVPTAVFAMNHRSSTFLLRVLAEAGLRIPQDVAVVGFDDFELASLLSPPLTTVAQSAAEMVRRAMTLLMERIASGADTKEYLPAQIVLPTRLIVRESCGCSAGASPVGSKADPPLREG